MLGRRNPDVYGVETQDDLTQRVKVECDSDTEVKLVQSNHEGVLVDQLNDVVQCQYSGNPSVAGILINPAALTHTSIALRDAIEMVVEAGIPVVEVHLSNLSAREDFRKNSLISEIVNCSVSGLGASGYSLAARKLIEIVRVNSDSRNT
ncbi:MAG: type 3-dehydroquinate dehydratase [Pseudomonadota bacterium]